MSKVRSAESLVFGIVLLALGTLFLLDNLGWDIDFWRYVAKFWPLVLIVFGVIKIRRAVQQRMARNEGA